MRFFGFVRIFLQLRGTNLEKKRKLFRSVGSNCHVGKGLLLNCPQNISIGNNFHAGENLRLASWPFYRGKSTGFMPSLIIGDNVSMMSNCQLSCMNEITIGDGCLFGDNVFITDNLHGKGDSESRATAPIERELYSKGPVHIGSNVWVGRNVCIMPNVSIGDGAIIGANAVVTHNVPAGGTAVGVPAKIIKQTK